MGDTDPCFLAVVVVVAVRGLVVAGWKKDVDREPTFLVVVVKASAFQLQASSNVNDSTPFEIMVCFGKSRELLSTNLLDYNTTN